jgi:multidrug resistance efflux pump
VSEEYRRIFREEALVHHTRGGVRGDVLQLTPRSFFWVHYLLLVLCVAIIVFSCMGQIDEYASGPAVVRIEGRNEVTAPNAAVIERIMVSPGDHVAAGDVLMRFAASAENAELSSIERELSDRLAAFLRDPGDREAREAVSDLRSRRELARASVERKTLRADRAGIVGDVRIRSGQLVEPGMPLCTLLGDAQGSGVITALLPGQYLPLLAAGQTLRLTLDGFEKDVQGMTIERVGDQIIGPQEAARYLGRELGDAFPLSGPVVLVHARMSSTGFQSGHIDYRYYHGMHGRAEVAVRTRSIVRSLFPELSGALFDGI